jgi:hypothetical protein
MEAEPVAGDAPGQPVRYAVALHVLMSRAELDLWQTFADRRWLDVDDAVHAAALSGLTCQLARDGDEVGRQAAEVRAWELIARLGREGCAAQPRPWAERRAHERRLRQCRRALQVCGWERLAPLAQHMAEKRLVRGRGDPGAPLRHLDVHTLRAALSRMLSQDDDDGYLIYQLVVEGAEPTQVAAERGVSCAVLVELLRDAVEELAITYEDVAYASLGESAQERARATLAARRNYRSG